MILYLLSLSIGLTHASQSLMHTYQLENYQLPGYFRSVQRNIVKCLIPGAIMAVIQLLVIFFTQSLLNKWYISVPIAIVNIGTGYAICRFTTNKNAKKKYVVTSRIKRLIAVSVIVHFILALLIENIHISNFIWVVFSLLLPLSTAFAGCIAFPIEKGIQEAYFRDAQKKLESRPDLIKIGITGSYGKTSVKFMLGTMLAEKYQVLVPPSSFNTPMGLTRIIRTKLQPAHQVFLAEMGARHVGDIKELCRLVHPTLGVLTSVGPQHLDTFKTIERIKNTKYELMDAIPGDGACFFADDQAICRELYERTTTKERHIASLSLTADAEVWAQDIQVTPQGSVFTLCTKDASILCQTKLLGTHSIQNLLLCSMVCLKLNMSLQQIARGISKIAPVEHRLQLISNPGGMTIIDDAFNSNPKGTEAALDVLRNFPKRRIIVTPGMVELGSDEASFNYAFGENIATAADIAILIGPKHTQPIREGLESKGFSAIHTVRSLEEATALLRSIGKAGDTVLFENDLPDNYSE